VSDVDAVENVDAVADAIATPDPDPPDWPTALNATGASRERALAALHQLLVRIARTEVNRRSGRLRLSGPELDDLVDQAAGDALVAIIAKLDQFRGESRFTTWAYKFVIFEVSTKIGRHFWRHPTVTMDPQDWERIPDRFGVDPADHAQRRELVTVLRHAVDEELSDRQRQVFVAIVVHGVPLDALVVELDSNRNAIYKTMFDARRKLRAALAANGYLDSNDSNASDDVGPDSEAVRRT
jgi:RNA polymerase sigma-70 factor (ECF subfamily)